MKLKLGNQVVVLVYTISNLIDVCFHEALKLVWQVYFGWTITFKVKAN